MGQNSEPCSDSVYMAGPHLRGAHHYSARDRQPPYDSDWILSRPPGYVTAADHTLPPWES